MRVVTLACSGPFDGAVPVGPRPGKDAVDPLLDADRLVVVGTDADLAAVVLRLLRKEKLATVSVALVASASAARAAADAAAVPVPLVRDDLGGVLVAAASAELTDATVYCDDRTVLRGSGRLAVRPGGDGVLVRVRRGWRRGPEVTGRAVQVGCAPAVPVCDGVAHPRPLRRWTWYRHTEDLLFVNWQ